MRYQKYFRVFGKPGWLFLAGYVGYCTWFFLYNHPCQPLPIILCIIIPFGFILTPILGSLKNRFMVVGLVWLAIWCSLSSMAVDLMMYELNSFKSIADEEFIFNIVFSWLIGLVTGAFIGMLFGYVLARPYKWLNGNQIFQRLWILLLLILLGATLPSVYSDIWGAFSYRWLVNDFTAEHSDTLIEALKRFDEQSEYKHTFAFEGMYVYTYREQVVELWVPQQRQMDDEPFTTINLYKLELYNGVWEVSEMYGRCIYSCHGCTGAQYADAFVTR